MHDDSPKQRLYTVLSQVPSGTVISYGQLAELCGMPRAARWAGRTLAELPHDSALPWHRVVSAHGKLSLGKDSAAGQEQRNRLRAEGISVNNNQVNIKLHRWHPEYR